MWEIIENSLIEIGQVLADWLADHLVNILVILVGAWLVRHFSSKLISSLLAYTVRPDLYPHKSDRDKRIRTLKSLVSAFVRIGVYIIAAILLIGEVNPSYTTALFASAGVVGVALGFGAQSLIRDFVSGIFIITENQYRIGDEITLTAAVAKVSGTVEDLTIRTTVLRDLDGNLHHMPNGNIIVTTNKTIGFSRVNEEIIVAYGTDLDRLEHVIKHVGEQIAALPELKHHILKPPYLSSIEGLGEKGFTVKILAKTSASHAWQVRSELYKHLLKAFDNNDIKIVGAIEK